MDSKKLEDRPRPVRAGCPSSLGLWSWKTIDADVNVGSLQYTPNSSAMGLGFRRAFLRR